MKEIEPAACEIVYTNPLITRDNVLYVTREALSMQVRDVYLQAPPVGLHQKGGKQHEMPCHYSLEKYLDAYGDAGGLRDQPPSPLFRKIGRGPGS